MGEIVMKLQIQIAVATMLIISLLFLVLSRIYAAPITRLGCLAFEGQGAFAPQS
jgi:hypothetical protein